MASWHVREMTDAEWSKAKEDIASIVASKPRVAAATFPFPAAASVEPLLQATIKAATSPDDTILVLEDEHECFVGKPHALDGEVVLVNGEGIDIVGPAAAWYIRAKGWTGPGGRLVQSDDLGVVLFGGDDFADAVKSSGLADALHAFSSSS